MYYIFKEMEKSIYSEEDKVLFNEAVTCFNSGAYRAAFIITWLTIAESLKLKLKEMATRDHELQDFVNRMESGQLNSSIDQDLVTKSKSIGLLDEVESLKISNIQQLRNKYAHPNNVSPHSDEVIAAIRIAVDTVLSKKPLLRHGYVKKIIKSMKENYHYLEDDIDTIKAFTRAIVPRIHQDVFPFVLRQTLKEIHAIYDDPSVEARYLNRLFVFINTFFEVVSPDFGEEKWDLENIFAEYPIPTAAFLINEKFFQLVGDQLKSRVISTSLEPIKDGKIAEPSVHSLRCINKLKNLGLLSTLQIDKYQEKIKVVPYNKLKEANIPATDYFERIISDLKIRDWYVQNPVSRYLPSIKNEWSYLNEDQQVELGRNILQAADGDSDGAHEFIKETNVEDYRGSEGIIKGILFEIIVNERNKFRFKGLRYIYEALAMVCKLDNQIIKTILEGLINNISITTLSGWSVSKEEFKKVIEAIKSVKETVSDLDIAGLLDKLLVSIQEKLYAYENEDI